MNLLPDNMWRKCQSAFLTEINFNSDPQKEFSASIIVGSSIGGMSLVSMDTVFYILLGLIILSTGMFFLIPSKKPSKLRNLRLDKNLFLLAILVGCVGLAACRYTELLPLYIVLSSGFLVFMATVGYMRAKCLKRRTDGPEISADRKD